MRVIGFYFDILGRIAFAVLLGFLAGYGLAWAISNGYFQTWQELPSPPAKATALTTAVRESIYIRTADDQSYRCTDWKDECWIREPMPADQSAASTITQPCISSKPEFFLFTNAPRDVVDCLQVTIPYPDAYGRSAYILDKEGRLWNWSHITSAYTNLFIVYVFPGLGAIVGLVVGIIWAKRSGKKVERASSA